MNALNFIFSAILRYNLFLVVIAVFCFTKFLFADSLLSKDDTNILNKDVLSNETLVQEEIFRLGRELEELNIKLKESNEKQEKLEKLLDQYRHNEKKQVIYEENLKELQNLILQEPFLTKDIEDPNYSYAYQAIVLGNLEYAKNHLKIFVDKKIAYVQSSTEENLIKEDNEKSVNPEELKKQEFEEKVLVLKTKAYYLLGEIDLINIKLQDAITNYSQAYKYSNRAIIVLLSLSKIVVAFDMLDREKEVCITVQNFTSTLDQVKQLDPSFVFPVHYVDLVNVINVKRNCSK